MEATATIPFRSGLAVIRSLAICAARSAVPPAYCGGSKTSLGYFALARGLHEADPGIQVRRSRLARHDADLALGADPLDEFVDDGLAEALVGGLSHIDGAARLGRVAVGREKLDTLLLGSLDDRGQCWTRSSTLTPMAPTP